MEWGPGFILDIHDAEQGAESQNDCRFATFIGPTWNADGRQLLQAKSVISQNEPVVGCGKGQVAQESVRREGGRILSSPLRRAPP